MNEPIKYDEGQPITIVQVANGYKVIPAREEHAYPHFENSASFAVPNEEYVFPSILKACYFLENHFERDKSEDNGS